MKSPEIDSGSKLEVELQASPAEKSDAPVSPQRRRALLVLGGAMLPAAALAQQTPRIPTPTVPTLPIPGLPTPTQPVPITPRPATPVVTSPAVVANPLGPIDRQKAYFLFFQQTIDFNTMKTLRLDLVALAEGGVTDISLIINSNGGQVLPVLQMYSLIQLLPVKIKTHAQVFVDSAANILFLAGQDRSSDSNAKFRFHPIQTSVFGTFDGPQFEDQLRLFNDSEAIVDQVYRDRTKLSDSEINRFKHETVVYDAAEALEHGIIQKIGGFRIPGERTKLVFVE